ncbi:hypothetical protein M8818_005959 [Zalaria obscura]|uniref:Uncharacterized protein n=1 Tax=Zalaria obscura TaxID=2024903 RepID=A0ACC3S9Q3_9PEZI
MPEEPPSPSTNLSTTPGRAESIKSQADRKMFSTASSIRGMTTRGNSIRSLTNRAMKRREVRTDRPSMDMKRSANLSLPEETVRTSFSDIYRELEKTSGSNENNNLTVPDPNVETRSTDSTYTTAQSSPVMTPAVTATTHPLSRENDLITTLPQEKIPNHRPVSSITVKTSPSKGSLRPRSPTIGPSIVNRLPATPPLPPTWDKNHDRAICILDVRDYSLSQCIKKLRRAFPELTGTQLTPVMIDKRLRQLDQDIEINYWRIGLKDLWENDNASGNTSDALRSGASDTTHHSRKGKENRTPRRSNRDTTMSISDILNEGRIQVGNSNSNSSVPRLPRVVENSPMHLRMPLAQEDGGSSPAHTPTHRPARAANSIGYPAFN